MKRSNGNDGLQKKILRRKWEEKRHSLYIYREKRMHMLRVIVILPRQDTIITATGISNATAAHSANKDIPRLAPEPAIARRG